MKTQRTLVVVFSDDAGFKTNLRFTDPKENITMAEVNPLTSLVVQNGLIDGKTGVCTSFKEAYVIERTVAEIV